MLAEDYFPRMTVEHFSSGEQMLRERRCHPHAPLPSLLVMDFRSTELNGVDLLARLAEDRPFKSVPIFVLSSALVDEDIDACRRLGAAGVFTKPINLDGYDQIMCSINEYRASNG